MKGFSPAVEGTAFEQWQHDVADEHAHVAAVQVLQVGGEGSHPEADQAGAGEEAPHVAHDVAERLVQGLSDLQSSEWVGNRLESLYLGCRSCQKA